MTDRTMSTMDCPRIRQDAGRTKEEDGIWSAIAPTTHS